MHQRTDISIRTRRILTRAVLPCLAIALVLTQIAARSEAVMRGPIDAQLDRVAYALNGRISVGRIEPAGLWGMRLRDVRFLPHTVAPAEGDRPLVTIASIRVRPRLAAMLSGRPDLAAVRIDEPVVTAVVDPAGGAHADWFRWLTNEARSRGSGSRATASGGGPSRLDGLLTHLPLVEVRGGHASFDDPTGRFPSVGVRLDHLDLAPAEDDGPPTLDGLVYVEGLGRGEISGTVVGEDRRLSLRLLDQNDVFPLLPFDASSATDAQLAVGSIHVDWPPRIRLADVRATGLDARFGGVADAPLERIDAGGIALAFDGSGVGVAATDVTLVFADGDRLPIASSAFHRPWNSPAATGTLQLRDTNEGTAVVTLEAPTDDLVTVRADVDRFDVMPLIALAHQPTPARAIDGHFTGRLSAEWSRPHETLTVELDGGLDELALDIPLFSREPLRGLAFGIAARTHVGIATGQIVVERSRFLMPALGLYANAQAEFGPTRSVVDLDATLPRRPAQGLLEALPAGVTDSLIGTRLEGELGARLHLFLDTDDPEAVAVDFELDAESFRVAEFGPLAPIASMAEDDFVWHVRTFDGTTRRIGPGDPTWVRLDEINPLTYRALVAAEDDRFWIHAGIDHRAIVAAARANLEAGDVVRGGSTISQQVVKNLFLNHDRTLSRKLQEAFLTWQLEQYVPKRRILEFYINLAHWGPHVYGIRDAAMAYFDHVPSQLTLRESVFLAAILPNPTLFGEQYTQGIISPSRRTKMSNVLNNLHRAGYLSAATLRYHQDLVARGNVSNTPPPTRLGEHERDAETVGIDRVGSLFFE